MSLAKELEAKIDRREARVVVVGAGYVGLPLAVEIARAGLTVFCLDISEEKIKALKEGKSYVKDIPSSALLPLIQEGRLRATTDFDILKEADCVSICVPTPLGKTKD